MKRGWVWGVVMVLSLLAACATPTPGPGTEPNPNQSPIYTCRSSVGYASVDAVRADLLVDAKKQAVGDLYGELIRSVIRVANLQIVQDELESIAIGKVHLLAPPEYVQGPTLADVCIRATFYVTEDERQDFMPQVVQSVGEGVCLDDIPQEEIADRANEAARLDLLYRHDGRLLGIDKAKVLQLLRKVDVLRNGFIQNTGTYCVALRAEVWQVEIDALLEDGSSATAPAGTPSPIPTETPQAEITTPLPTETSPNPLATPTTALPTPIRPTPTPQPLTPPSLISPVANGSHNVNTSPVVAFRWNGGTPCGGEVSCTLYLDRIQGGTTLYGVYSRLVTGTGYDWPGRELEPGNYQWTIVLRRGVGAQVNPEPRRLEIVDYTVSPLR